MFTILLFALICTVAHFLGFASHYNFNLVKTANAYCRLTQNNMFKIWPLMHFVIYAILLYLLIIPITPESAFSWLLLLAAFISGVVLHPLHLEGSNATGLYLVGVATVAFLFLATPLSSLLSDEAYKNAVTIESREEFDPTSTLLDGSKARFVDQALAVKAMRELIGEEFAIGSRYSFDDSTIQKIGDELLWVAPLRHKGVIKWLNNKSAPGYAYVNQNDYDNSALIITDQSRMVYGDDGYYFNQNVRRHVYLNGYADKILSDYPRFELDNAKQGYWIFTEYKPSNFLALKKPVGVVTVNAQTGEIARYTLADTPEWIDTIFPDQVMEDLIEYAFNYVKGPINAWFLGEDIITPSKGTFMVYTTDGSAKWYTGMQSSGAQEGTMGFVLADTRTGVVSLYRRSGNTEHVAKNVAEGMVQDLRYSSSDPLPHNVNGVNTFISILKDASGNKQGVALVRYSNRNVAAWGRTYQEAERRYMTSMAQQNDDANTVLGGNSAITVSGQVLRISHVDDTSYLTLLSPGFADKLFSISHAKNLRVVVTQPGDEVLMTLVNVEADVLSVVDFTNLSLASDGQVGAVTQD